MSLAPWNNPLVISGLRVKYRRGSPFGLTTFYLLALVGAGAWLEHTTLRFLDSFVLTYYVALVAVQWFVSSLAAHSTAMQALKTEVSAGTFDIQRIASLSPRDIVLGKLLGEPAVAYLLLIASFPLAFLCALGGAVSLPVLGLTYLTLVTSTLLSGLLGLRSQLVLTDGLPARKASGCLTVVMWGLGWQMLAFTGMKPAAVLSLPYLAAVLALITPLPLLAGIASDNPWAGVSWFGVEVPYLVLTPLAQLGLAYWVFRGMQRQLIHPLAPGSGKGMTYVALLVVDLLTAGFLFDQAHGTPPLWGRIVAFWVVHLLVCLYLGMEATPYGPTLRSWVWRFRPATLRDAWLGDRSANGLMLLTYCGIGLACLVGLVIVPAVVQDGTDDLSAALPLLLVVTATTILLILALGALFQWLVFRAGPEGAVVAGVAVVLAIVVPHVGGLWYDSDPLKALSPSAHYWAWAHDAPMPVALLVPMLAIYAALLVGTRWGLRRDLRFLEQEVDRKLTEMQAAGSGACR